MSLWQSLTWSNLQVYHRGGAGFGPGGPGLGPGGPGFGPGGPAALGPGAVGPGTAGGLIGLALEIWVSG